MRHTYTGKRGLQEAPNRNETQMFRWFIDRLVDQGNFRFKMSAPAMQNVLFSLIWQPFCKEFHTRKGLLTDVGLLFLKISTIRPKEVKVSKM